MKPYLHIVTPVSRPPLLPLILPSIEHGKDLFDITWWTVFDSSKVLPNNWRPQASKMRINVEACMHPDSIIGNAQNNLALDNIPLYGKGGSYQWVTFLSDDNAVHPDYFRKLLAAMLKFPHKKAFIYHQQVNPAAVRYAALDRVKVEGIDLAQYTLRRDFIDDERMELSRYQSDGVLIENLFNSDPSAFHLIDNVLCYYNRLR